jgi:hypothetical protein
MAVAAAALLAGCSDASRFSADPFSDPFGGAPSAKVDRSPTHGIDKPRYPAASPVQSRPLPPVASSAAVPRPVAAPAPVQSAPAPVASAGKFNHWSAEGGAPVVVAQGENAGMIANRYGVPTDALLHVNGYQTASQVQPGARMVIPVYRATAASPQAPSAERPAAAALAAAKPFAAKPAKGAKVAEDDEEAAPAKAGKKAEDKHSALKPAKPAVVAAKAEKEEEKAAPVKANGRAEAKPVGKLAKAKGEDGSEEEAQA